MRGVTIEARWRSRAPAQLIKVEEIIPEGFDMVAPPDTYRLEDSYLNMKGRRLDPLRTEELKLVLRPRAQGRFTLRARILYLDETGRYKSHEPEPVEVTVRGKPHAHQDPSG